MATRQAKGKRARTPEFMHAVVDDGTAERLIAAAESRGVPVDRLVATLLVAALDRIDDLLPPAGDGQR